MGMEMKHVTVFVVLAVFVLVQGTDAATYVVGDSLGWTIPSGGASAYATWAAKNKYAPGDILVFNYPAGVHDVATVTKTAYDSCSSTGALSLQTVSPTSVTLTTAGTYYFICTFGQHCSAGQKLTITVTSTSATTPSASPPTAATPPPTATTKPSPTTPSSSPTSAITPPPTTTANPPSTTLPMPPSAATPPTSTPTLPPTATTSPSATPTLSPTGASPTLSPTGASPMSSPAPGSTTGGGDSPAATPPPSGDSDTSPPPSSASRKVVGTLVVGFALVVTSVLC